MMSIAHLLEDFGTVEIRNAAPLSEEELEAIRVAGYETGYKAGWEDALKTQADEVARVSEEFARNLQDLSFTYHEAHGHVMQSMAPFLEELVDTLLPQTVRETIGLRVAEQLNEMARQHGHQAIEIVTSEHDIGNVQRLLNQDFGFPVNAVSDDTLAEGQVFLRMGQDERQIDMGAVMAGIRDAVAGILDETERTLKHG